MRRGRLRTTLGLTVGLLGSAGLAFLAPPAVTPASAEGCEEGLCVPGQGTCPAEAEAGPFFVGTGDAGPSQPGCAPQENCDGKLAVRGLASYRTGCGANP